MQYWAALFVAMTLNALANLLMKVGAKELDAGGGLARGGVIEALRQVGSKPVLILGLFCFACNVFLYIYALQSKSLKISLAYPIMVGGGFAIIAVVARIHPRLAEQLSASQWAGVLLILTGVVLVAAKSPTQGMIS